LQGISIDTLDFSINSSSGEQIGWISPRRSHMTREKRSLSEPENMHEGRMRFELGSALKQGLLAQQELNKMKEAKEALKPTPERFYMMAVFFWACFVQGITWMPLSSVPQATRFVFPGMSDELIFWSLNIAPIIYVPTSGFASYLLTREHGMQRTLRMSALFSLLCASIRIPCVLAPLSFRSSSTCSAILLLSGAFCGIAGE
jgi:hypothetical protein